MTLDLDDLERVAKAATPGPWYHCQPGVVVPKQRTIHGPVPARRVDYVSTWNGMGTPPGHRLVVPMPSEEGPSVRSGDMAHIAAFDPPTALALLARARDAERLEKALRCLLNAWQTNDARSADLEQAEEFPYPYSSDERQTIREAAQDAKAALCDAEIAARQALSALNEGGPANG